MDEPLILYFTAEKQESLLFMLVGVAAVGVAVYLFMRHSRYRAMAYPLVVIAAIQVTVGGTVYFRTDGQVAALQAQLQQAPAAFKAEETRRMEVVARNFELYRWIEILLLAAGLALALLLRGKDTWHAVGLGLALQSALMLVLDLFAEKRAEEYLRFVAGL